MEVGGVLVVVEGRVDRETTRTEGTRIVIVPLTDTHVCAVLSCTPELGTLRSKEWNGTWECGVLIQSTTIVRDCYAAVSAKQSLS